MTTLLLLLAGPLQSWGDSSRFTQRLTRREPTKSGVIGMLAAAQGRRRTDPVEELVDLEFAVRIDQPGSVLRDFQTAIRWQTGESMPLSQRYYLEDAVFVAGVGGDPSLVNALSVAVREPRWAPYLGRRSCPPARPVHLGVVDTDVRTAVTQMAWQASAWHRRASGGRDQLVVRCDARPGERSRDTVRDVPRSWDPRRREYAWRDTVEFLTTVVDDERTPTAEPDFFEAVGS